MLRCLLVLLSLLSSSAHAVDGVGLQLGDAFLVIVVLFSAAAPLLLFAGLLFAIVLIARAAMRGPQVDSLASEDALPPAIGSVAFTDEEADLMQRCNIFFNGTQYRRGESQYDTLAEAAADAIDGKPAAPV
jgi:hypothetical protein